MEGMAIRTPGTGVSNKDILPPDAGCEVEDAARRPSEVADEALHAVAVDSEAVSTEKTAPTGSARRWTPASERDTSKPQHSARAVQEEELRAGEACREDAEMEGGVADQDVDDLTRRCCFVSIR